MNWLDLTETQKTRSLLDLRIVLQELIDALVNQPHEITIEQSVVEGMTTFRVRSEKPDQIAALTGHNGEIARAIQTSFAACAALHHLQVNILVEAKDASWN